MQKFDTNKKPHGHDMQQIWLARVFCRFFLNLACSNPKAVELSRRFQTFSMKLNFAPRKVYETL